MGELRENWCYEKWFNSVSHLTFDEMNCLRYVIEDCIEAWTEYNKDCKYCKQKRIKLIAVSETFVLFENAIKAIFPESDFKDSEYRKLRTEYVSHAVSKNCRANFINVHDLLKIEVLKDGSYNTQRYDLDSMLLSFIKEVAVSKMKEIVTVYVNWSGLIG